jgi:hypothetical protein
VMTAGNALRQHKLEVNRITISYAQWLIKGQMTTGEDTLASSRLSVEFAAFYAQMYALL